MKTIDLNYVAARQVLLDVLEALQDHLDAVVLVGAQAVYLRTGDAELGVAPFTTDADLALDSDRLSDEPRLELAMGEQFRHQVARSGAPEPGIWERTIEIDGSVFTIPVDLIVPEGTAPPGGRRGARLGVHGNSAARKAPGLEAALFDHGPVTIGSLSPGDVRQIVCNVAGPAALLIAKAHKIHDRLAHPDKPNRLTDKDASDVYRLMQTTPVEHVNAKLIELLPHDTADDPIKIGVDYLGEQFAARRSPGVEMAVRALDPAVPAAQIREVCTRFVADLQ